MKLPIYENKKIVKTYTASTYDLMFGTVEDVLNVVKLENLKGNTEAELIQYVADMAARSMDIVKGLLMDIFDGLTEEEIRNTKAKDIARVLVSVLQYAIKQIGGDEKN